MNLRKALFRWLNGPIGVFLTLLSGLFWFVVLVRGFLLLLGPGAVTPLDALWPMTVVLAVAAASLLGLVLLSIRRLLDGSGSGFSVRRRLEGGMRVLQGVVAMVLGGFLVAVVLGVRPWWGFGPAGVRIILNLAVTLMAGVLPLVLAVWGFECLREGLRRMVPPEAGP